MRKTYLTPQQVSLLRGEEPARRVGIKSAIVKLQKRGLLDQDGNPTEAGRLYLARYEAGQLDKIDDEAYKTLRRVVTIGELAAEFAAGNPQAAARWRERIKKACQAAEREGHHWCRRSGKTWLIYAAYARRRWAPRVRPEDLE